MCMNLNFHDGIPVYILPKAWERLERLERLRKGQDELLSVYLNEYQIINQFSDIDNAIQPKKVIFRDLPPGQEPYPGALIGYITQRSRELLEDRKATLIKVHAWEKTPGWHRMQIIPA